MTSHSFPEKNFRYIYIVACAPNSIIARAIRIIKGDKYTHVGIAFGEDISAIYSFSRKYSRFPFIGAMNEESLKYGFLSRCRLLPGVVMRIPVSVDKYESARSMTLEMLANKRAYKYNVRGLIAHAIPIRSTSKNRFTCSEFVAYILNGSGVYTFDKPDKIRPQHMMELGFESIFEGDLFAYRSLSGSTI